MLRRYYKDNPEAGYFYHLEGQLIDTGRVDKYEIDGQPCEMSIASVAGIEGRWSGKFLPQIGARVKVTFNGLGAGVVVGYFKLDGYIGVEVLPDKRPDWHLKQNGMGKPHYLVFGAEIAMLTSGGLT